MNRLPRQNGFTLLELVVVLAVIYVARPLDFGVFPTVL